MKNDRSPDGMTTMKFQIENYNSEKSSLVIPHGNKITKSELVKCFLDKKHQSLANSTPNINASTNTGRKQVISCEDPIEADEGIVTSDAAPSFLNSSFDLVVNSNCTSAVDDGLDSSGRSNSKDTSLESASLLGSVKKTGSSDHARYD